MIKKIFGVIFIMIAIFFGLGFVLQIPTIIGVVSSDGFGYSVGYIIGSLIFLVISIGLFKFGLKWIKNKPESTETIDQIGKS